MKELLQLSAARLWEALEEGELSAAEAVGAYLDRIDEVNPNIHAYLTVREEVMDEAREVDRRRAAGEELPLLAGVPVAIKDNLSTRGVRTTCASRMLENYVPPYDATVVEKLRDAGALQLGKTNLDEFAMGSSSENSYFGPTRNPWDLRRVPGGSSSGSAAAVAAGLAPWALGSDTGGSIRQPASFCGIVGLKPTYGRVSRWGLVAFASSLDQVGPLTRDVRDCALLLEVISGQDDRDATSAAVAVPRYQDYLGKGVRGLVAGVPKEYFGPGVDPGVRWVVEAAIAALGREGVRVEEVSLPHSEYALSTYYIVAPAEASANLARYDGVRYGFRAAGAENEDLVTFYSRNRSQGFGAEVKRRIMLGTYVLSAGYYDAYYLKAQKVRSLLRRDFEEAFQTCDFLVGPTSPTVAFPLGERSDDPWSMYLADVLTVPVNLVGVPALSLPVGLSAGLPVGLQIIGKPFDEGTLLRVGRAVEELGLFKPVVVGGA